MSPDSFRKRLAWFVAIWLASVAALGLIAYVLRWVLA
ncbi:DUF2474 family protein [Steroidobacter sp. S1-65]|uniref:DUF2474 family protein n=1 Tax=Steroidobacter gossypii TaxID=2805490 RepID=A0ABS1WY57_9GAMM|nr:DUF2474 family protein [Steroidobacter gossypii]MBM0105909.1 DUF2474 family protein [Steroidobacter gossypii]